MNDSDMNALITAASDRRLAVATLQKKYESSASIPTEQLVLDMREMLATERVVLDAIITLFLKLCNSEAATAAREVTPAPDVPPIPTAPPHE